MHHIAILSITLLAFLGSDTGIAKPLACPVDTYNLADDSLGRSARDWIDLNRHWQRFRACDDGALAEGYSDGVVKLFAEHWNEFGSFAKLAYRNSDFRDWAIRHIDASTSSDDLKAVVRNAGICAYPLKVGDLCRRVKRAARTALLQQ